MSSTDSFATLAFFAIGLVCIVTGLFMIRRGLWPRRVGDQPHCRACGYLLIGIESDRCPECGGMLWPSNVVRGHRRRSRGLAFVGAAVLLFGLGGGVASMSREFGDIPWYHFKPTFPVIRDLRGGMPLAADAVNELNRREKAGNLSGKYERQVVELALAQQATTASGSMTEQLIGFLQRQYFAGNMTEAQKSRFGQQSVVLHLRVRPIVVLGDRTPVQITSLCRVCSPDFYVHIDYEGGATSIDGQKLSTGGGGSNSMTGLGSEGGSTSSVQCSQVGKHQLSMTSHVELRRGNQFGAGAVVFREDRIVTAPFEVVANPPQGYFILIHDAKLGDRIKASIVPADFHFGRHEPRSLDGNMIITTTPANIAFDVFARFHDHEYSLGGVVCDKGASTDYHIGENIRGVAWGKEPAMIDVILRSNAKAARESIDQNDIWSGELVYHDVPVVVDKGP